MFLYERRPLAVFVALFVAAALVWLW